MARLLGPDGRSLLIGRSASLRRWAGRQLGLGPKPRGRPRPDLRGVARAVLFFPAAGGFRQRLIYERLMAESVPAGVRPDLRAPGWLRLDTEERFPRVVVETSPAGAGRLAGPFRDREAAARARDRLQKRFSLRPCDYEFDPDPRLPLGLGCVYAQVRSCAAPCLARIGEEAYRALARRAAALLADPGARAAEERAWLPEWVTSGERRALVVERSPDGLELYPVRSARVLEDGAASGAGDPGEVLARLRWPEPDRPLADAAWLADWLSDRRRAGALVVASASGSLGEALAAALAAGSRE